MDKSYKKPLLLITFGVILFAAFNNLNYAKIASASWTPAQ